MFSVLHQHAIGNQKEKRIGVPKPKNYKMSFSAPNESSQIIKELKVQIQI